MFGLGTTEILLIVGAGLLIFGAKRLPEVGAAMGKGLKNFKKALEGRDATQDDKSTPKPETKKPS